MSCRCHGSVDLQREVQHVVENALKCIRDDKFCVKDQWPCLTSLILQSKHLQHRSSTDVYVQQTVDYIMCMLASNAATDESVQRWCDAPLPLVERFPHLDESVSEILTLILTNLPVKSWSMFIQAAKVALKNVKGGRRVVAMLEVIDKKRDSLCLEALDSLSTDDCNNSDPRFNVSSITSSDQISSTANRLNVGIARLLVTHEHQNIKTETKTNRKRKSMDGSSLIDISHAIYTKKLNKNCAPHPCVPLLYPLFNQLEKFIAKFTGSADTSLVLSDQDWSLLSAALQWKDRMLMLCSETVSKVAFNLFLPKLVLHWQFLNEDLLKKIPQTWLQCQDESTEKLLRVVEKLTVIFSTKCGPVHELSDLLCQNMEHPIPYSTEELADVQNKLANVEASLKPNLRLISRNVCLTSTSGQQARSLLVKIAIDSRKGNSSHLQLVSRIAEVEKLLEASHAPIPKESSQALKVQTNFLRIQSWPLIDYIVSQKIQRAFLENTSGSSTRRELEIQELVGHSVSIPLDVLENGRVHKSWVSSHLSSIASNNTATRNTLDWITYPGILKTNDDEEMEEVKIVSKVFSPVQCILNYLLSAGTAAEALQQLRIGVHSVKSLQLYKIRETLWSSWATLADPSFSPKVMFVKSVRAFTDDLLQALSKMFSLEYTDPKDVIAKMSLDIGDKCGANATALLEEMLSFSQICDTSLESSVDIQTLKTAAKLGCAAGTLQGWLAGHMQAMDPALRRELLLQYSKQNAHKLKQEILQHSWNNILKGGKPLSTRLTSSNSNNNYHNHGDHPHLEVRVNQLREVTESMEILNQEVAYRPEDVEYVRLTQDVSHFIDTAFNPTVIKEMVDCLSSNEASIIHTEQIDRKLITFDNFFNHIHNQYPLFRDVTSLFLQGLSMTTYSMRALNAHTKMRLANSASNEDITQVLASLCSFPTVREPMQPLNHLMVRKLLLTALADVHQTCQDQEISTTETKERELVRFNRKVQRLSLRSTLLEVYTAAVVAGRLDCKSSQILGNIVQKALSWWRDQEEEKKLKEQEDSSLYKYKAKEHAKNETEEETLTREFTEIFPSYEKDFDDLKEVTLEQVEEKPEQAVDEDVIEEWISQRELWEISEVHSDLLSKLPYSPHQESLTASASKSDTIKQFGPIPSCLERVQLLQTVMNKAGPIADSDLDQVTIGAHLIFNHTACKSWRDPQITSILRKPQNFYIDPRPIEAAKLRPLLMPLLARVEGLLEQWPEHPSLVIVAQVIERVFKFHITAPMARLLSGLESILLKTEIWEANAHKGVSLGGELTAEAESTNLLVKIKKQIVEWRKLELHEWKNCLELVQYTEAVKSKLKWWPHMYECLTKEDWDSESITSLTGLLKDLMDNSTLGDYESKLMLLLAFYRHLLLSKSGNTSVTNIIFNVYNYFKQFLPFVKEALDKERKEIETKVKETVKVANYSIATFRDINQVRQKVTKCCQSLHSHMGKWKRILLTQDKTLWAKDAGEELKDHADGIWDVSANDSHQCTQLQAPAVIYTENISFADEDSVLCSLKQYSMKAHEIVNKTVSNLPYADCVEGIEDVTGSVITSYRKLATETSLISSEPDKDVRKSKFKHIMKMRRTNVTRLFQQLKEMGIQYHRGNNMWKEESLSNCFQIPTFDIDTIHLDPRAMKDLELILPSCDKYFYRSMNRFNLLTEAFVAPHVDLSTDLIKRMKGVTKFLMITSIDLRKRMYRLTKNLTILRNFLNDLECAPSEPIASVDSLRETWDILHSFSLSISMTASEVSAVIDTQLDKAIDSNALTNQHSSLVPSSHNSSLDQVHLTEAKTLLSNVEIQSSSIAKMSGQMLASFTDVSWPRIVNESHIELVGKLHQQLNTVAQTLNGVVSLVDPKHQGHMCLTRELVKWLSAWSEKSDEIESMLKRLPIGAETSTDSKDDTSNILELKNCTQSVMYAIQTLYKNHTTDSDSIDDSLVTLDAVQKLEDDIKSLKLNYILKCVGNLISEVSTGQEKQLQFGVTQITSLLQQYANLSENLLLSAVNNNRSISKMLSVLLAIFYQMALKGFCKPEDTDEEQQAGGQGQMSFDDDTEAAGLAEGEGKKDMSDKLESEDQLESALQEGEKENPGDDNLEEDNGVEMSKDFEGKLQDVDKQENNESDEEDDDNDDNTQDQMGQTEEGAETLDKKLWNDKDDNDNQEEQEDMEEDENAQGNENEMESQIVAKEKDNKKNDKKKKNDEEDEKNAQDKNDKPEEMEEDRRQPNKPPEDTNYDDEFEDRLAGEEESKEQEDKQQENELNIPDDLNIDEPEGEEETPEEGEEDVNPIDIEKKGLFPEGKDIEEEEEPKQDDQEDKDGLDGLPEEQAKDKEDEDGDKNPDEMEGTEQDFNADVVDEEEEKEESKPEKEHKHNAGLDEGDEAENKDKEEAEDEEKKDEEDVEASKDKDTKNQAQAAQIDSKDASKDKTKVRRSINLLLSLK